MEAAAGKVKTVRLADFRSMRSGKPEETRPKGPASLPGLPTPRLRGKAPLMWPRLSHWPNSGAIYSQLIDLIGRVFGDLTVMRQAPSRMGEACWLCRCSCGAEKAIRADNLRGGRSRSCGHTNRLIDLTGQRFGHLTVVSKITHPKEAHWLCCCDCGAETVAESRELRRGERRSCGCQRQRGTHGMTDTPEWRIWQGMLTRCRYSKHMSFKNYGGRGILVCGRWANSFENFFLDMGNRPSAKHSIDRIDNDGNYEPSNCKWSTAKEQARNKRKRSLRTHCPQGHELTSDNVYLKKDGKRHCKECERQHESMRRAVKKLSRTPLILLNNILPLIPHDCLPSKWPPTIETAAILAQKVSAKQALDHEGASHLRHSLAAP